MIRRNLIILDWMLPGLSGIELCRRLRVGKASCSIPILILTARGGEQDRIRGLTTGADDYVVKPFSVPELMARVRAILRRASPERLANTLEVEDIELDREAYRVKRNGREVRLGPTEFKLLEFMMESPGRVFTRTQLLDGVWGRDVYVDERTVDVHIRRLRKAINRGKERDPIRTVRGAAMRLARNFRGKVSWTSAGRRDPRMTRYDCDSVPSPSVSASGYGHVETQARQGELAGRDG